MHCRQNADVADKAGDRAHGECATREAEEEQLIARLVVVADEIVDLDQIDIKAPADAACERKWQAMSTAAQVGAKRRARA